VSIAIKSGKSLRTIVLSGSKVRVLTLPREGGGVVQVARELRDVEEFEASLAQTFVWTLPLVLVLGAAGALFLANRALKPVARLAETADQISAADLSRRLPLEGDDEFTRLGQTVNKMIGRLESSFHDLEAVVENQRRFTADASHELRTPLTRLQLAASSALDGNDPALMREALKTVDRASEEMSQLVQQLLTLSRADAGALSIQVSKLDLREPVVLALDELANPRIDASLGEEPVMISGNSDAVRRIAGNLIRNALTYTASESKVRVLITGCSLVVSDDGPGISAEDLPRLGERFFRVDTARASGSGNGLGLAIVKALAEAQGARLEIRSDVGKGSEFSVVFQPSEKESHCWS
jgi:signal transduction histidine kinase